MRCLMKNSIHALEKTLSKTLFKIAIINFVLNYIIGFVLSDFSTRFFVIKNLSLIFEVFIF
jgi:hypothetical protein